MRKLLLIFIYFATFFYLQAQERYNFTEYEELHPDINMLSRYFQGNGNSARNLLFLYHTGASGALNAPVLLYRLPERTLTVLSDEQIEFGKNFLTEQWFWDIHTRKNYMYLYDWRRQNNNIREWYSLSFADNFLTFNQSEGDYFWAKRSPPYVHLAGSRLFTMKYTNIFFPSTGIRNDIKIIDMDSNEILWEHTEHTRGGGSLDIFWVTDSWCVRSTTYFSGFRSGWQHEIFNYETGETVSFAPEIIIGYGKGVILTTRAVENCLIGITVWTPEKEILYRDNNFSISGIRGFECSPIGLYINVSYFDYPYIYINSPMHKTLILNLLDGRSYLSPHLYNLFGIFDAE
jgi:hypothetical protein